MDTRGEGESHDGVLGGAPAVGHVLPDDHTQAVAGVIPARRLNLDVFADHVAADFFGVFDVKKHRFFAWGGIETLREVTLVERTILENGLVVKRKAPKALSVTPFTKFAHAKVAAHLVHHHAVNFQLEGQVVEMWVIRMPLFGVGDVQQQLTGSSCAPKSHFLPFKRGDRFQLHTRQIEPLGKSHFYRQVGCVEVRRQFQAADVLNGHNLEPDRLPDT